MVFSINLLHWHASRGGGSSVTHCAAAKTAIAPERSGVVVVDGVRALGQMLAALLAALALSRPLPTRILSFGDSLTAGLIANTKEYAPYGETLSRNLNVPVVSRGVVLESSHSMPSRLSTTLNDDGPFDCAIILGGSNDLWKGDSDAIWVSLQSLYSQSRAHGCSLLGLITLPPFEPDVMKWLSFTGILEKTDACRLDVNERIRAMAAADDDCFLVDLAVLDDDAVMARPDGLHFEATGYERLGVAVGEALSATL